MVLLVYIIAAESQIVKPVQQSYTFFSLWLEMVQYTLILFCISKVFHCEHSKGSGSNLVLLLIAI